MHRMTLGATLRLASGIVVAIAGSVLIAVALGLTGAAAFMEATVGRAGVVTQPLGTISAPSTDVAVLVDGVSARLQPPEPPDAVTGLLALADTDVASIAAQIGEFTLVVKSTGDSSVFLGVAPVDSVNAYLQGTPYAVAVRDGQVWSTVSVPGSATPVLPEAVDLWSASSVGNPAELAAADLTGETLIIMNPDGTPGVEANLTLEYRVPGADRVIEITAVTAAGASVGGLMLVLGGAWLVVGRRGGGVRGRHQ